MFLRMYCTVLVRALWNWTVNLIIKSELCTNLLFRITLKSKIIQIVDWTRNNNIRELHAEWKGTQRTFKRRVSAMATRWKKAKLRRRRMLELLEMRTTCEWMQRSGAAAVFYLHYPNTIPTLFQHYPKNLSYPHNKQN